MSLQKFIGALYKADLFQPPLCFVVKTPLLEKKEFDFVKITEF